MQWSWGACSDGATPAWQAGLRSLLACSTSFGELAFAEGTGREAEEAVTRRTREVAAQLAERVRKEIRMMPFATCARTLRHMMLKPLVGECSVMGPCLLGRWKDRYHHVQDSSSDMAIPLAGRVGTCMVIL